MQSSNPLIVLSVIGAVVAANAIVVAPATAESGSRTQPQRASRPVTSPESTISQADRLDQLQTENQLRQQLNQSQFGVSQSDSSRFQFEQQIQQQINLQELRTTPPDMGVRPSTALDQLQFEQRVRRNLQQPASRPDEQSQARTIAANPEPAKPPAKPDVEAASSAAQEPAQSEAATQTTGQTTGQTATTSPELTKQQQRQAERWVQRAADRLMADAPPSVDSTSTETAKAESQPLDLPGSSNGSSAGQPTPTSSDDSRTRVSQAEAIPSANIYSTEGFSPDDPSPDYLNPDANPLTFPTTPAEVEIVGTQPLTIRQAIELSLRNNPTFRQVQFQLERSQADLRRAQAANLPTLDANAGFTQAGAETGTVVPSTITNSFGQEQVVDETIVGNVNRNYTDTTELTVGLQLNYNIFTSGRRPALIRAAEQQVRIQQLEVERQAEQLILDTVGDYYDLQEASARVNIFKANLFQAEQSLRDAQALERAGVGTRFDSLQAEVDVANARQDLTRQLSTLEIAQRSLAERLNISQAVDLTAADPIEVAGVWDLSLEETIVQAYKNRVELEQQLVQRDIAEQNRKAALAALGPQVGFQGAFNLSSNDFELNGGPNYSYSLGLNASLALYDGGDARSQANREESNISIAEAQFETQRDAIRQDIEEGYSRLNSSFANIQTTALAVEQATEALRLARLRFQAGVGTQTDVLRQQSVLANAQVNSLTAILDYNRSLAVLQRGTSNYPEGYLNDQP